MKVIVTAGGTGGHIYPALALIDYIKQKEPNSEILYIGTHNRMEKEIIPKRKIPYQEIEIYGLNKKKIVKTFYYLIKSFKKCKKIIKDFNPDIVIGFGGYVTFPVILSAHFLGVKTFIHEQNSIPGKSNRILEKYVDKIGVSFLSSCKYFKKNKTILTGNPCSANALLAKPIDKSKLGLHENKRLVLIVMGSLGSRTLGNIIVKCFDSFADKDYEVLFITGNNLYDNFKNIKHSSNVKIIPFYEGLTSILKKTDLIITRAGASTLSEIISLQIPSILIPSPYVANNHQYINAKDLEDNNAAFLIEEKDASEEKIINLIDNILNNSEKKTVMKENLKKLQVKDSASIIYKELRSLIDNESNK